MELTLDQHIIHHLLLRSSVGIDVGLYHGKMGLILFFVHYFRHTGQPVYDDTADRMIFGKYNVPLLFSAQNSYFVFALIAFPFATLANSRGEIFTFPVINSGRLYDFVEKS